MKQFFEEVDQDMITVYQKNYGPSFRVMHQFYENMEKRRRGMINIFRRLITKEWGHDFALVRSLSVWLFGWI